MRVLNCQLRSIVRCAAMITVVLGFVLNADGAVGLRRHLTRPKPCENGNCPAQMTSVKGCDGARAYLFDAYLEELLRAWAGYGPYRYVGGGSVSGGDNGDQPGDFTTTNVQETGVDEIDIVKTNGTEIYTVLGSSLLALDSWPAKETKLLGGLKVVGHPVGLFLDNSVVAVVSVDDLYFDVIYEDNQPVTTVSIIDVSDPSAPKLRRRIDIDGYYKGARMIDGHVYLMLQKGLWLPQEALNLIWYNKKIGLPVYKPTAPEAEKEAAKAEARAILARYLGPIIANSDLSAVLPRVKYVDDSGGASMERNLISCNDLYRPLDSASLGMLALVHFDLASLADGGGEVKGVGLLASGWTIYASAKNFYVADGLPWWWWFGAEAQKSSIHKFELDGTSSTPVRYVASGSVPGYLLNQFSMGEYNGYLRVASTLSNWWRQGASPFLPNSSVVTVLQDEGQGYLVTTGQVKNIAPGERIYSARFLGERGFLVTFRQTDPLFTFDLSDPKAPKILGELEVPGFSNYLHPVGDTHLLAVGRSPDAAGRSLVAVSLFDVRDLTHPSLAARYLIKVPDGAYVGSEAEWDHHAFTFHRNILTLPFTCYGSRFSFSGLVEVVVDLQGSLQEIGRVDHTDFMTSGSGSVPILRRSIYIEDNLYSLSTVGVKVTDLYDPEAVKARVKLTP